MKTCDAFFLHLGKHRVKTAGMFKVPQILAALNTLGVKGGVIEPEIAAAHGVLPEGVELPPPPPPPEVLPGLTRADMEALAKEEVLALLRNTPPVSPAAAPTMPVKETKPARPAPPATTEVES